MMVHVQTSNVPKSMYFIIIQYVFDSAGLIGYVFWFRNQLIFDIPYLFHNKSFHQSGHVL